MLLVRRKLPWELQALLVNHASLLTPHVDLLTQQIEACKAGSW